MLNSRHTLRLPTLVVWIAAFGASSRAQMPTELWSVDLSTNPNFAARKKAEKAIRPSPHLQFGGNDFIVVGFDDDTPSYPEPLPARHFKFHLLELDSGSGKFERQVEFPVVNGNSDLQATADNNLLLLTGEELLKLSPRLETLQSLATPLSHHGEAVTISINGRPYSSEVYEWWKMGMSSSGKVVLLQHKRSPQEEELRWISTDNLTTRQVVAESQTANEISGNDNSAILETPFHPLILSASGTVKTLPDCQRCGAVYFVSQDRILEDLSTAYRIVDLSGSILREGKLKIDVSDVSRSLQTSKIAFTTGFIPPSLSSVHFDVIVFDLISTKELSRLKFTLPIDPQMNPVTAPKHALALSPDGKKLAVLFGDKLTCYSLE